MTRNFASSLAFAATVAAAAAAILSGNAYADDITFDNTPFVSGRTRAEVQSELKTPYLGGNPWSSQYRMHPLNSTLASEQLVREYKMSRDEVNALTGEDSGSAYFIKSAVLPGTNPAAAMGAPAR
jgi:hypothetical protein